IVHERLDLFLDSHVRHHFAGDLAESRQPIRNPNEAAIIDGGDVTRDIPAGADRFCRFFGLAEVAKHAVRPLHEQQSLAIEQRTFAGRRIDDHRRHPGQRMTDGANTCATLALTAVLYVRDVDGDYRRHLGAAVTFKKIDAEFLLERGRNRLAKSLRSHNRVTEVCELLTLAL